MERHRRRSYYHGISHLELREVYVGKKQETSNVTIYFTSSIEAGNGCDE
jgi:hypothetical protein